MRQQVDWSKVTLLLVLLVGGGYVAMNKLGIKLPELGGGVAADFSIPIPTPVAESKRAVQPLVTARATNPKAAKVVGDFLASYAFVIENNEQRNSYNSSDLMRNIESGLESLFILQREVGDIDVGPALNKSLQTIWGDETKTITKAVAAEGIYACAWGLQL